MWQNKVNSRLDEYEADISAGRHAILPYFDPEISLAERSGGLSILMDSYDLRER